jgi:hypothetical protein
MAQDAALVDIPGRAFLGGSAPGQPPPAFDFRAIPVAKLGDGFGLPPRRLVGGRVSSSGDLVEQPTGFLAGSVRQQGAMVAEHHLALPAIPVAINDDVADRRAFLAPGTTLSHFVPPGGRSPMTVRVILVRFGSVAIAVASVSAVA